MLKAQLVFPPKLFTLPELPTFRWPIFTGLTIPNLSSVMMAAEMQFYQLTTSMLAILQPLVNYLQLDLASLLPKIPGLNFNMLDLLEMKAAALFQAVEDIVLGKVNMVKSELQALWAMIPFPLYYHITNPATQIVQTVRMLVRQYMMTIVTLAESLIKQVTDKLQIPGMPTLPTFPTLQDLMALLIAQIPNLGIPGLPNPIPDIGALWARLKAVDFMTLFDIHIPGFPSPLFTFPIPLVPSITIPEIDFNELMINLYGALVQYPMTLIKQFIDETLSKYLGFSFPKICVPLSIPDVTLTP